MRKVAVSMVMVVLAVASAACGDDGDDGAAGAGPDPDRYCELTAELEQQGEEIFGELPEDATEEDFVAAERRLVEENEAALDELVAVAPEEIADDVETYVTAFRARAAGEDADASDEAILAWEEENCPA